MVCKTKIWRKLRINIATLSLLSFLTACGSDPGFNEATDFINEEGSVQFVNMIADAPELTILHGLSTTATKFAFSSPIEVRFEDNYDWRIAYLDENNNEVTVTRGENQTIVVDVLSTYLMMGSVNAPNVQIADFLVLPVADRPVGTTDIWAASNTTNFSMLDVYLTDLDADLTTVSPNLTVSSGAFTQLTPAASGDSKQLRITLAGSTDVLFDSGSISIPDQSRELFAIIDDFGPDGANRVDVIQTNTASRTILPDQGQPTSIRVGNYTTLAEISVDAGEVNFPDISRATTSAYTTSATGSQALVVKTVSETLSEESITLPVSTFASLLIFDDVDAPPATSSLIIIDEIRNIEDRLNFQFVNGTTQVIDLFALRGGAQTNEVAPALNDVARGSSGVVEITPGPIQFAITTSDGATTLVSLDATLQTGSNYTLIFDTDQAVHLIND